MEHRSLAKIVRQDYMNRPIRGVSRPIRTFHADFCSYLSPRIPAYGHFSIDKVVWVTLPAMKWDEDVIIEVKP